jgi:hypothetical protein
MSEVADPHNEWVNQPNNAWANQTNNGEHRMNQRGDAGAQANPAELTLMILTLTRLRRPDFRNADSDTFCNFEHGRPA